MIFLCGGVMNIVVVMMLILLDVSEGISVENCIGLICMLNLVFFLILVIRLIMMFWMLLVLVLRKVKGMFVGVELILSICCVEVGVIVVIVSVVMVV